jgi:endonuclease-3 related protein
MRKLDRKKLAALIHSTGYYNEKSKKIKTFVKFIDREFKGNLNRMAHYPALPLRSKLLGVNGIGPETADSILLYAFNKPFFVIDAYTCRIFKRLGILTGNESYDEIRHMFESSIKDNLKTDAKHKSFVRVYNQYHACIVNLGKDFCTKRNPKCRICPLYRIRRCTI